MAEQSPVFEETRRAYLDRVFRTDITARALIIGAEVADGVLSVPFFGQRHTLSPRGIAGSSGRQPRHSVCVTLCQYVLRCPESEPLRRDWVTYRDFKDAAPFVGAFAKNTEGEIARHFSGRLASLKAACTKIGGRLPEGADFSHDLVRVFEALPRIPLLMLFNDADEDFPARCSILFERRAEQFLDMECLAMVGWLLADHLRRADGFEEATIT